MRSLTLPAAVLWDMDGTLIDSEPHWIAAETDLAATHGITWTHSDALSMVGISIPDAARTLRRRGVEMAEDDIVEHLVGRVAADLAVGISWQPGARALLEELASVGVPCALVTMSYDPVARQVVDAAPAGIFDVVITGDIVERPKPHPDPYLMAAAKLGVDIGRCVAIEDSLPGIASAEASGARVIAVPHIVPIPAASGRSRVTSLNELTLRDLARICAGEVIDRFGTTT